MLYNIKFGLQMILFRGSLIHIKMILCEDCAFFRDFYYVILKIVLIKADHYVKIGI